MIHSRLRPLGLAMAGLALAGTVAGCSNSSDSEGSGGSSAKQFAFWDPYPQFDNSSDWVKLVKSCGEEAGVTIKRTGYDTSDLTSKALLAGQQGASPDVIVIDNPVISTLADAGVLTSADELKLDTSPFAENIAGAGVVDDKAYGVPIGANTLALYYNEDLLKKAGVDPASVKDWASLNAALAKVKAEGAKGITFSGIGTEEGSFQFLPWFWGAGANLKDLASPEAVSAVKLWDDWLAKGYAPNSVINNTQTTAWQEFETGKFGFVENGTWQMGNAEKLGFKYGIISIPAKDGGGAPVPTGGEFVAAPVQKDTARYAKTTKIIDCLTSPENLMTTDTTLSYIAPIADVQEQQASKDPKLAPWVKAVGDAKGRTSDNLGTNYPIISEQMWGAFQNAMSGSDSPESAMQTAQKAAASKVK
jgi:multiple sugar transport system substrate-binding protein